MSLILTGLNNGYLAMRDYIYLIMVKFGLKEKHYKQISTKVKFQNSLRFFSDPEVIRYFNYELAVDENHKKIVFKCRTQFNSAYAFISTGEESLSNSYSTVNVLISGNCFKEFTLFNICIMSEPDLIKFKDMLTQLQYYLQSVDEVTKSMNIVFTININDKLSVTECIVKLKNNTLLDKETIARLSELFTEIFYLQTIVADINPLKNFNGSLNQRLILIPYLMMYEANLLKDDNSILPGSNSIRDSYFKQFEQFNKLLLEIKN